VVLSEVLPDYDEIIYYLQALGFETIFSELLHGRLPGSEELTQAYGNGWWLPLHPALCGLFFLIFGKSVAVARFVVVLISAATAPLIYLLASKVSSGKSAFFAALIHIFYPNFIAYSHLLWSETTFIFLLLFAVYFAILVVKTRHRHKRLTFTVLSGFFLGLCGLTRATFLPMLVVLPCWLGVVMKSRAERILLPSILFVVCVIVISPWEYALMSRENHFIMLSKSGAFGLYMGNNPWVPREIGSSQGVAGNLHRDLLEREIRDYMTQNNVDRETAQVRLAMREIRADYLGFFTRALYKVRMLWNSELLLMRHILHGNYPPLPNAMVATIWALVVLSYIMLIGLIVAGLLAPSSELSFKSLFLALTIAGATPPLIAIAVSRFHIPLLALLLPAAGVGAVNLRSTFSTSRGFIPALSIVLVSAFSVTSLPMVVSNFITPSSYYSGLIGRLDRVFGSESLYSDIVIFRINQAIDTPDIVRIRALNEDSLFHPSRSAEQEWDTAKAGWHRSRIRSHSLKSPLRIALFSKVSNRSVVLEPIRRASWWEWQPSGLPGIEYRWLVPGRISHS
jgi:4-amino-4-deoxy-L-arabinose transferase-like glycosyltransferase